MILLRFLAATGLEFDGGSLRCFLAEGFSEAIPIVGEDLGVVASS